MSTQNLLDIGRDRLVPVYRQREMVLERGQGEESLTVTLMGDAQTQEAGQEEGNGVDEG